MAARPNHHLTWEQIEVCGRPASYGVAGRGIPLVFLHGWGVGYRSYKRALKRLVAQGFRVYAPGLPGLSGTADLPRDEFCMRGYAAWVDAFLDAVGVHGPVTLVGHSFGGGVAIQTAHDYPERVSRLVLVNSLGGSAWRRTGSTLRSMAERPLWDWGVHFQRDVLPIRQLTRVLPVVLEDAVPNLLHNPRGFIRVAGLARSADLTGELEELKRRRLPVVILWGENDKVIPQLSFESLRDALGGDCITVAGSHGWLLADPDTFGEVMTNVVGVAALADAKQLRRGGAEERAVARSRRSRRTA